MALAAMGSMLLSLRSRGTVSITDEGIFRTVKAHTHFLAWPDVQGLVPMPYGGVTLVAINNKGDMIIPRFVDDYRACIAEIKGHSIQAIAPSSLQKKRRTGWKDILPVGCFFFFLSLATSRGESHTVRLASFSATIAFSVWMLKNEEAKADVSTPHWFNVVLLLGILIYGGVRMRLTW